MGWAKIYIYIYIYIIYIYETWWLASDPVTCVLCTCNHSFYPSTSNTTSVRRADSSILIIERQKFCGHENTPQSYYVATYIQQCAVSTVSSGQHNALSCDNTTAINSNSTGYDRHDIHILCNVETKERKENIDRRQIERKRKNRGGGRLFVIFWYPFLPRCWFTEPSGSLSDPQINLSSANWIIIIPRHTICDPRTDGRYHVVFLWPPTAATCTRNVHTYSYSSTDSRVFRFSCVVRGAETCPTPIYLVSQRDIYIYTPEYRVTNWKHTLSSRNKCPSCRGELSSFWILFRMSRLAYS